jgi:glutathione S-transferase
MYTLYYSPGSVSMVSHMIIEELGVPFEAVKVDLSTNAHRKPEYLAINPKAKVPALRTPDGMLTESVAILETLLDRHGDGSLLAKPGTMQRAKTMEAIAFFAADIHPLMNRYFHADDFASDEAMQEGVKKLGVEKLVAWFRKENEKLTGEWWSGGATPTVADHYFTVIARWGRWFDPPATRMKNIEAFLHRMAARPAVQRALAREGNTLFS